MSQPQLTPVQPKARIDVIDVIRGFALLGVLIMNMGSYSGLHLTTEHWSRLDQGVMWLNHFLFEAKFYSIFSFLFGLGMAIQMIRAEERGAPFLPVYLRRLFFLLIIGFLHATFLWVGDILFIYAVCGFILLLFRKLSPKMILVAALLFFLHPLIISLPGADEAVNDFFGRLTESLRQYRAGGADLYTAGSYFQLSVYRFWEGHLIRFVALFTFGNVFGMFLFGLYAGRRKLLHHIGANLPFFRRVMGVSLVLGLLLNGLYVYFLIYPDTVPEDYTTLYRRGIRTLAAPSLCFFYVTALILLYQKERWRARLSVLAPLGRMALTNYLMQSLVMTSLFYGYGLGLYGELGPTALLVLALLLYGVQIRLSAWWLERYRFGPAEWVWRSLTYGRRQPLRVDVDAREAIPSRPRVALAAVTVLLPFSFILWQGWLALPQEEQQHLTGGLIGPTPTLAPPTPQPTPTPTLVATPAVKPVVRQPKPAAAQTDLRALALAFDEELALSEIETLTGPPYLGRAAGSPGGQAAGDYIARRFAEYGLRPAGLAGTYFQPFPIVYNHLSRMPALTVTGPGGQTHTYRVRHDFAPLVGRYTGGGAANGPVVWVNECTRQDFAYADVADKVAFCLVRLDSHHREDAGRNALEHGAAGLLLLFETEDPWPFDRLGPYRELWVPQPIPAARISEAVAATLVGDSGLSLEDLLVTVTPMSLPATVRLAVPLETDEAAQGRNILGVLPGRDPDYAEEVVVVGAHYDHMGQDPDGTAWVGANDNASGVAVLLETARSWQAQGYVPRRTVLFAAWDAEEIGLEGSRYYVIHPQYSISDTMGMLQLDMVGAGEETLYLDRSAGLTPRLHKIAPTLGISTTIINGGGSDHVPFQQARIPAGLMIWAGMEDSEATAHYHRPLDTPAVIQPEKLAAAGRLANLALLALAEGEPALLDLVETRLEALKRNDVESFLETSTAERRELDAAWFDALQELTLPRFELEATNMRVVGDVATATVRMEARYTGRWAQRETEAAWLPVRFVQQQNGDWLWAGPALARRQPQHGLAVAYPPEYETEAVELSRLARRQYNELATLLGLPSGTQAELVIYPDQQTLAGDTRLTLPDEVTALVDQAGENRFLVKLAYTPHLSQTHRFNQALAQLLLAEAGLPPSGGPAPWLRQGLPVAIQAQTDPLAVQPDTLAGLSKALVSNNGAGHASPLTSDSLSWAAVEYLRTQVGWSGLGQLVTALGRGHSPDQALIQLLGINEADFETRWRQWWQQRLRQADSRLAALLDARQQAVLAGDDAAFMATVASDDPLLVAEEQFWFNQLATHPVEQFALSGHPIALLEDGSTVAEVTMTYKSREDRQERSQTLPVRLVPAAGERFRWGGPLFETVASGPVTIHYPAGYEALANRLLPEAKAVYHQVATDLELEKDRPVTVKLYKDFETFRSSIALSMPDWLDGWAAAGQAIKLPVNGRAAATTGDYRRALARQVTRSLLFAESGNRFDWLHEGLAIYESSRLSRTDAGAVTGHYLPLLSRTIRLSQLFTLAEPLPLYGFSRKEAQPFYAQSWDMVRYLVESYGQGRLLSLLKQVARGQPLAEAFSERYGLSLAEFESGWREAAGRGHARPAWIGLARHFDPTMAQGHILELTGPDTAGRAAGLPGQAAAAAYIADQFAAYGLTPGGDDHSYLQRFPITYTRLISAPRLWPLDETGRPVAALRYRQDFLLVAEGALGGGQVEAELLWLPGQDLGQTHLGGKIILREPSGPVEAEVAQAIRHGAGGLILVGGPRPEEELRPKSLVVEDRRPPEISVTIPVVELTEAGFENLLAVADTTPIELERTPVATPLGIRVRLAVPLQKEGLTSANVLGLLPGSDPTLQDELIIISAPYDHVGDDPDDRVCLASGECLELPGYDYPGANEDGAAVGTLLEILRVWQRNDYRPARPVLFAAWGGQELDQAGARYYGLRPTRPLSATMAALQLESVGGGLGFRIQAESELGDEAVLRAILDSAAGQVEGRLNVARPSSGEPETFRQLGIPTVLIRWEKAEPEDLPAQFEDEIEPAKLGQVGRTVTLALMILAE